MAKKKNTALLVVGGLAIGGLAVYLLTKKSTQTVYVPVPTTPTGTVQSGTSSLSSILSAATGLFNSIFGNTAKPATNLPGLAQTSSGGGSPAADVPYINPFTPGFTLGHCPLSSIQCER